MTVRRLALLVLASAAAIAGAAASAAAQWRITGAASASDAKFAEFFDQYSRRAVAVGPLPRELTLEFARQLRRAGPPWAGPREAPDTARRRLVLATIAVDFVNQNFEHAWGPGFSGELIEWACDLLRSTPPAQPERTWHLAAVIVMQRASAYHLLRGRVAMDRDTAVTTHLEHAERRFPGDDEWALARAVDAEHAMWPPPMDEDILRAHPDLENRFRTALRRALDAPAVRQEAHLRWAYFHSRRGRWDEALDEYDLVGHPADPVLRYWLHLLRGRTLTRLKRPADALASYRKALDEFPSAQAAAFALSAALVADGQAGEARELVTRVLTSPQPVDPWRTYGAPATRHWPRIYGELRKAIAP
jgi:tetratricopeptide (TPR) repeat protein